MADAWVSMPTEEELRPMMGGGAYDFGFIPAMGRLIATHPRIGAAFGAAFVEIMFSEQGALDRREREMVAAVAAGAQDCHY